MADCARVRHHTGRARVRNNKTVTFAVHNFALPIPFSTNPG